MGTRAGRRRRRRSSMYGSDEAGDDDANVEKKKRSNPAVETVQPRRSQRLASASTHPTPKYVPKPTPKYVPKPRAPSKPSTRRKHKARVKVKLKKKNFDLYYGLESESGTASARKTRSSSKKTVQHVLKKDKKQQAHIINKNDILIKEQPSLKHLYMWKLVDNDPSDKSLKIKFKKVPKSSTKVKSKKNIIFLKQLAQGGEIRNNPILNPDIVTIAKPQPFFRRSSKTGAIVYKGRRGKLFPLKKKIPISDPTATSSSGLVTGSTIEEPQPGPSYVVSRTPSPSFDLVYPPPIQSSPVLGTGFWTPTPSEGEFSPPDSPINLSITHSPQPSLPINSDSSRPPTPPIFNHQAKPYKIVDHRRRYVQKFGLEESIFKIIFSEVWLGNTIYDMLDQLAIMFEDVMDQVRKMYMPGVRARLYINHPDMQYEAPIFIALRPIHLLTAEAIMNAIEKVLNSNRGLN